MKKAFCIIVALLLCKVVFADETIRLASGEWPPYYSEHLEHYGYGSRIVTEAFALEGIRVEYDFYPWKRGLALARQGALDGAAGWQISDERQAYFYSSDPVWEAPWVFFHRKSVPFTWRTLDDLRPFRIGGTMGYMYTREFMEAERSGTIHVDRASSDALGFKKLLSDRFDIFPQLIDVGYYQLQAQFDPATVRLFTHHPKPLGTYTETLLLSKKRDGSQRWVETFNRGLRKLRKSGRYQQFFEEYLQAYRH